MWSCGCRFLSFLDRGLTWDSDGRGRKKKNGVIQRYSVQSIKHLFIFVHSIDWIECCSLVCFLQSLPFNFIQFSFNSFQRTFSSAVTQNRPANAKSIFLIYWCFFVVIYFFLISAPPSCRRYWTTTVLETLVCSPTTTKRQILGAFYTKWRGDIFHQAKRQWK